MGTPVIQYALEKRLTSGPFQVVQKRKANPTEPDAHKDLLDRMLTAVDTKTGEKMTVESIVDNVWFELDEPQRINTLFRRFVVDYISHRWSRDYVWYAIPISSTSVIIDG